MADVKKIDGNNWLKKNQNPGFNPDKSNIPLNLQQALNKCTRLTKKPNETMLHDG